MKTDIGVGTETPIVKDINRVETVVPGVLAFYALIETIFIRLLLRSYRYNCPIFQFYSCMIPVPLIT